MDISTRREMLNNASIALKKKFVGLDSIIDKIISNISVWYFMPEIMRRPVIINLWGMTGVGKTDLVRTLINELKLNDIYCEIQLSTSSKQSYNNWEPSTVLAKLQENEIESGMPSVFLFDEMQRFKTFEKDTDLRDLPFQDIWELLSDGKLREHVDLSMLMNVMIEQRMLEKKKKKKEPSNSDENNVYTFSSTYQLRKFKKLLRLNESLMELSEWSFEQKMEILHKKMENQEELQGEYDYSKSLIFISGNLDDAYKESNATDMVDVDADYLHEISKHITIFDIKRSLRKRFRPEQIARLGNIHIIYPSLSRLSYSEIISRKVSEFVSIIKEQYSIDINIDQSVHSLIYRNGVYPSQGTRPLFSTIGVIMEANMAPFIFFALENKLKKFTLSYSDEAHALVLTSPDGTLFSKEYMGEVDIEIEKNRKNKDVSHLVTIHELGHSIVYANEFGVAPPYIRTSTANKNDGSGFIIKHNTAMKSKNFYSKQMRVSFAGLCAEELVFGDGERSDGCASDISNATIVATKYVRRCAMHSIKGVVRSTGDMGSSSDSLTSIENTNTLMEDLLKKHKEETYNILKENEILLSDLCKFSLENGSISPEEFTNICNKNGMNIKVISPSEEITPSYENMYNEWIKKCNAF